MSATPSLALGTSSVRHCPLFSSKKLNCSLGQLMVMLFTASSSMLLSPAKGLDEIRPSIVTPTRLCFATEQTKVCSSGSASSQRKQQPVSSFYTGQFRASTFGRSTRTTCVDGGCHSATKQGRGLKIRRLPSRSVSTSILDLKCVRTERKSVIFARCSLDEEGPTLNRKEVVELLTDAFSALLKPENQRRLRERLEQSKQRIIQHQSKVLQQPSNVDQCSSTATIECLQDLEEVRHSQMEGDTIDSGRCSSDQVVSPMTTSVTLPITSQTTELVLELKGQQPRSIENAESSTESIEGKEDTSLTSIRRLKVLDVHSYVHNALRESALRSWLNSRTIEE